MTKDEYNEILKNVEWKTGYTRLYPNAVNSILKVKNIKEMQKGFTLFALYLSTENIKAPFIEFCHKHKLNDVLQLVSRQDAGRTKSLEKSGKVQKSSRLDQNEDVNNCNSIGYDNYAGTKEIKEIKDIKDKEEEKDEGIKINGFVFKNHYRFIWAIHNFNAPIIDGIETKWSDFQIRQDNKEYGYEKIRHKPTGKCYYFNFIRANGILYKNDTYKLEPIDEDDLWINR